MQVSCFGTPILTSIETQKNDDKTKGFVITTFVKEVGKDMKYQNDYTFNSASSDDFLYDEWGKVKKDVSLLLDEYVGKKVNRHGKEKTTNQD